MIEFIQIVCFSFCRDRPPGICSGISGSDKSYDSKIKKEIALKAILFAAFILVFFIVIEDHNGDNKHFTFSISDFRRNDSFASTSLPFSEMANLWMKRICSKTIKMSLYFRLQFHLSLPANLLWELQ